MRLLFDQGAPLPLLQLLSATHETATTFELGWCGLSDADLLKRAEAAGFDALISTDMELKHSLQKPSGGIAVFVLSTASWPRLARFAAEIDGVVQGLVPGAYVEAELPELAPKDALA